MNNRIFNYVESLFEEIPNSKKSRDLKSELIANLNERYEDNIRDGKSTNESFHLTISSLGNIDQLLEEVQPSQDFVQDKNKHLKRKALFVGVSVFLYILSAAILFIMGGLAEYLDLEFMAEMGFVGALIIVAVATGLIIYGTMSTPTEYREKTKFETKKTSISSLYINVYWSVITIIFFVLMFVFKMNNAWIIWVFAGISLSIISTLIKLRDLK